MLRFRHTTQNLFFITFSIMVGAAIFLLPLFASAAVFEINPSAGTFIVGSQFTLQVLLDTKGESVNAIDLYVFFPPDMLQVVPSAAPGSSFVDLWIISPQYNNQKGTVRLQGGIPNGINTSRGLLTSITFRVKKTGSAVVRVGDESKVLLNNGKGTDVLDNVTNGIYNFILPPPAGPLVSSATHQNQTQWHPNVDASLTWAKTYQDEIYSYILNDLPLDVPDDISEGSRTSVVYKNLSLGTHYFHIKAKGSGDIWGGVTHFALNVDADPPAGFSVNIEPSSRTTARNLIMNFRTTDQHSGIDRYEYTIIQLKPPNTSEDQALFIEVSPPETLSLNLGSYDIVVRAFDKAGNVKEETKRVNILTAFEFYVGHPLVILALALMAAVLGYLTWRAKKWHRGIFYRRSKGELPEEIKKQLNELRKYRSKYGKVLLMFLIFGFLFSAPVNAQQTSELSPPIITTVSRNISNEEIFYIGGKADEPNIEVTIYLQNLNTGETMSQQVVSGKNREWFYRGPSFLNSGEYLLWAQAKSGDTSSPPTPQVKMVVTRTALQFGSSRLSYGVLYLILIILLGSAVILLSGFTIYYFQNARKNQRKLRQELREAEEAVRRGFAVLRRDIQSELEALKKVKFNKANKELLGQERQKEEQLLEDLTQIEKHIGKEVWDMEKYLNL